MEDSLSTRDVQATSVSHNSDLKTSQCVYHERIVLSPAALSVKSQAFYSPFISGLWPIVSPVAVWTGAAAGIYLNSTPN